MKIIPAADEPAAEPKIQMICFRRAVNRKWLLQSKHSAACYRCVERGELVTGILERIPKLALSHQLSVEIIINSSLEQFSSIEIVAKQLRKTEFRGTGGFVRASIVDSLLA